MHVRTLRAELPPHLRTAALLFLFAPLAAACGGNEGGGGTGLDEPVATVTVTGQSEITIGETAGLQAELRSAGGDVLTGRSITWESSDESVATVDGSGNVRGVREGSATVTARSEGRSGTLQVDVEARLAAETVVVDSTEIRMVSTDRQKEAGELRFLNATEDDIAVGDVVVGAQGGGFLRRVTAVEMRGDTLVATTEFASLADAVEGGSFESTVQIDLSDAQPAGVAPALRGLPEEGGVLWGATRVGGLAPGVRVSSTGFVLEGTVLVDEEICSQDDEGVTQCGRLRVDLPRGFVGFAPSLNVGATFGLFTGLEEFHAIASGELGFDVDVRASAEAFVSWEGEQTLATVSKPFIAIVGGIPVPGVLTVDVVASASAELKVAGLLQAGATATTGISVGAVYDGGSWTDVFEPGGTFQTRPLEWELGAEMASHLDVSPSLSIQFFGIAGPKVSGVPYVDFAGSLDLDDCTYSGVLTAGVNLDLQLLLEAMDETLAEYTKTLEGPMIPIFSADGDVEDHLSPHSGDSQNGAVEQQLAAPIRVQVTDEHGEPQGNVEIAFDVVSGGGQVVSPNTTTDDEGIAETVWKLGPTVGEQAVQASAACQVEPVTFTAQAEEVGTGTVVGFVSLVEATSITGVEGATLTVEKSGSPTGITSVTGESGTFFIDHIPEWPYNRLIVEHPDIVPMAEMFAITEDQVTNMGGLVASRAGAGPGNIRVYVEDQEGNALAGRTVLLLSRHPDDFGATVRDGTTDGEGEVLFQGLAAGTYQAFSLASLLGPVARFNVAVIEGETVTAILTLEVCAPPPGGGGGSHGSSGACLVPGVP